MKITFDHKQSEAENITTFYFKPHQPVHYLAGQFTEFFLEHPNHDDRGNKRWFTLSSSPSESLLSITTKFAERPSTFKQVLREIQLGTELNFADPMGDFVLPKDPSIPLLFVAAGIGITPMRSMIKYLFDTKEHRDISLLYTVSRPEELVFKDLFDSYGLPAVYLTQAATPEWTGEVGKLTTERILTMPTAQSARIYISGPEPMVETFNKELLESGISEQQIMGDYFPGYTAV